MGLPGLEALMFGNGRNTNIFPCLGGGGGGGGEVRTEQSPLPPDGKGHALLCCKDANPDSPCNGTNHALFTKARHGCLGSDAEDDRLPCRYDMDWLNAAYCT